MKMCIRDRYEDIVADIISQVRTKGDEAVFSYTRQFDHCEISAENLLVTREEIEEAFESVCLLYTSCPAGAGGGNRPYGKGFEKYLPSLCNVEIKRRRNQAELLLFCRTEKSDLFYISA